jgi:hypothetical protein
MLPIKIRNFKFNLNEASFSWNVNKVYRTFSNDFDTGFTNLVSICIF